MRSAQSLIVVVPVLLLLVMACSQSPATTPSASGSKPDNSPETTASTKSGKWLSAREAVAIAYEALTAKWKSSAKLAFVGRYSQFCNTGCSPYLAEKDTGIGADGRQAHWIVIFADSTASSADVLYVEDGKARLVKSDIATIRPAQLFDLKGWIDSTDIKFRSSRPVGLELKTSDIFAGKDADLERYPLLWMAETSFGRYDVYDAKTGKFIKSR